MRISENLVLESRQVNHIPVDESISTLDVEPFNHTGHFGG